MNAFLIVAGQMVVFVIYAMVGVIAVKVHVLDEKGLSVLARYIMKISLPIMIFMNTLNGATREEFLATLPILGLTALMYLGTYFLGFGLKKLFRLKGNRGKVYHACTMFGNIGFMGIPILAALFPEQGMLYIAMFTVVDQLILWTVGMELSSPEGDTSHKLSVRETALKMINPATVGIVLAVIGIFAGVHLPTLADTALTKIGATTTPLAMIYLGGLFCYTDIPYYVRRVEFFGTVLGKMILFPLAFNALMLLIPGLSPDIRVAMALLSSMPTMSSIAMFANANGSEGEYSIGSIFITTVCSLVTLPLLCYLIA